MSTCVAVVEEARTNAYLAHQQWTNMNKQFYALVFASGLVATPMAHAQNTIGLVEYSDDAAEGFMLIYPDQQGTVFLLNECGQVVNTWPDTHSVPGNGARLFGDGKLMRTYVDIDGGNPFFTAGGNGESVQIKDWDNNVLWDYTLSSGTACLHHDAEVLPNGNVLVIAWELKTIEEAYLAGRDTAGFGYNTLWPDMILELRPDGPSGAEVVWAWHAWDHLIQDFNPMAENYGVVADHPELVDLNFVYTANNNPDWLHTNSVDYNAELDQIILSVPYFNEVWVIDHSTTTEEAAGHTGGNQGKGGDLLYRWGNPQAYGRGTAADQQLFFNHGALWVGPGLDPDDPDQGKIMVFNNRIQAGVSAADIFAPPVNETGGYELAPGMPYGPISRDSRFATQVPTDFSSPGQGSAQKLPNGAVLATSGRQGWAIQLRPDSTIAWSYVVPMWNGQPAQQGMVIEDRTIIFQAEWIQKDDPRLSGRDLDEQGYIELDPNTTFCDLSTGVQQGEHRTWITPVAIVADRIIMNGMTKTRQYTVYDATGRAMLTTTVVPENPVVNVDRLSPGQYILVESVSGERLRFVVAR